MSKERAHHMSGAQRAWRREKSATLAAALRGIAALEGVTVHMSNDVGMIRNRLKFHVSEVTLNKMLTRAAQQYEAANPRPRK